MGRIIIDKELALLAKKYSPNWESIKKIIPRNMRFHEMFSLEAEYLRDNPQSTYITDILPLKTFRIILITYHMGALLKK